MHEEPLRVLDDGRVALWVCSGSSRAAAAGLWMYDTRTGTCTEVAAVGGWYKGWSWCTCTLGIYCGSLNGPMESSQVGAVVAVVVARGGGRVTGEVEGKDARTC